MTKEPNAESVTLSRFFQKNINAVRSKNVVENFAKSANFCSVVENKTIDKRKNAKQKFFGPRFKGFTNEIKRRSEIEKSQMDRLVNKLDNYIKEENYVSGLFKKETESLNGNTTRPDIEKDQIDPLVAEIKKDIEEENDFFGFSKKEIDKSNRKRGAPRMEKGQLRNSTEEENAIFKFSTEDIINSNGNTKPSEMEKVQIDPLEVKIRNNTIEENNLFEFFKKQIDILNESTKPPEIEKGQVDLSKDKIKNGSEEEINLYGFSKKEKDNLSGNTKPSEIEKSQINPLEDKIRNDIEEDNNFFGFFREKINNSEGNTKPSQTEKCPIDPVKTKIRNSIEHDIFGFSEEEIDNSNKNSKSSDIEKDQINPLEAKIKNSSEEANDFFGFSKEEIELTNVLSVKTKREIEYFENNTTRCCRGFSKQEQNESISALSDILEKCVSIRNEIYKNIDRRILTYHLKEEESRKKVVCLKYWPKKEELTVKVEDVSKTHKSGLKTDISGINSFKIGRTLRKKNGVKKERVKTEVSELNQGNDFILEMHKIQQEVKTIRDNNNLSSTEDLKPEEAPFIKIKKELVMSPFVPPKSPHYLIEEELYHDPWALLVATIFLNKTSGRAARPYVFWFLEENPDPLVVLRKRVEQLERYFGALGLQKTRANQVWKMSHDFIYKKWQNVSELYGIGRYGDEAFRIFCLGDFSFMPQDRYLRIYKAWYEMQEKNERLQEMNS